MKRLISVIGVLAVLLPLGIYAEQKLERDVIKTSAGDLEITFIGHGTLMFAFGGKVIHVDPTGMFGDYSSLPKADIILITHNHPDHFNLKTLELISSASTSTVVTKTVAEKVKGGIVMKNGDTIKVNGLKVEAVPAYNLVHMRGNGAPFHPKGIGNGYIIIFGDKRVYVAGDTENVPEMKSLKGIDIAFLPMNLPYTMTPEMVADAAKSFRPKTLYPYHYGKTDTSRIVDLLKDQKEIEVRIRRMK